MVTATVSPSVDERSDPSNTVESSKELISEGPVSSSTVQTLKHCTQTASWPALSTTLSAPQLGHETFMAARLQGSPVGSLYIHGGHKFDPLPHNLLESKRIERHGFPGF